MEEIALLKRKLEREKKARKQAERILEEKALELYTANRELQALNQDLEKEVTKRTNLLRASEIKYRSIIENMELGLLEIDNNGNIIKSYKYFNEMLGYEPNELDGKKATDTLVVPEYSDIIQQQIAQRENGEKNIYEIKIKKKDNSEIWVLISGAPFFDGEGKIIGSIGIHYDITNRKRMEERLRLARQEAIQAQQAEKQFLASMSHEIRTPLNAIIGMTHLLNDTVLDKSQAEYLEVLASSASILKNLISDILDISKIDAGTLEVNTKVVNLKAEAYKLINIFKAKTLDSNVEFSLEFDDKICNEVLCDQQLLNQILINLLGNAEKFTTEGQVTLKITLQALDTSCYVVLFEVKDTGIGMSPLELEKIFEQFVQANVEIRNNYGGTGLGLTISKRLVDLMGGYIDVSSQQGKGTNFYFTLNLKITDKIADLNIQENGRTINKIPEQKLDILIVEDNEMNIKYITSLLKKWELPFIVSLDGSQALDQFKKHHFDIIFMDLNMPVMDGFEATRHIREMEHPNKNLPIVALTASTFLSKKQLALEAGMTDFLSKPFTPDQLAEIISKYSESELMPIEEKGTFNFNENLDAEHLQSVYGNDLSHVQSMFEVFLSIIDNEMNILVNHSQVGTKEQVRQQAHKMKPTFSMVGITHLSKKMEDLEDQVLGMEKSEIEKAVSDIISTLAVFIPILETDLEKINALEEE